MLATIGQISIPVKDVERATSFYRDTLGMRMLFAVPNISFFEASGIRLMLSVAETGEFDHPASVIYYKVDDIDAAHHGLLARGVHFRGEPHLVARMPDHELWMAFFDDSEGNVLALMHEKR